MGMFDDLRCEYPLPAEGANALSYQTKDTPAQWMEQYVIREDGTLWGEEYDTEDQSDPNAEGLMRLAGSATRVNKRPVQVPDFTGELRFYTFEKDSFDDRDPGSWVEWSSYFVGGRLKEVHLISDTRAARAAAMAGLPPDTRTQKEKFDALFSPKEPPGEPSRKEPTEMNWQPIETAPKEVEFRDGNHSYCTKILVYTGEVMRARWWQHKDGSSNFIQDGGRACYPTHWMPLPPPPLETEG